MAIAASSIGATYAPEVPEAAGEAAFRANPLTTSPEVAKAAKILAKCRRWYEKALAGSMDPWEFARRVQGQASKLKADISPEGLAAIAGLFAQRGAHDEAVSYFERARGQGPLEGSSYVNVAASYGELGRHHKAFDLVAEALSRGHKSPEAWNNHGAALIALKRYDEGLRSVDQALDIRPGYLAARLNRAKALCRLGRHEDAVSVLDGVLAERPDDANAYVRKGDCLLERGEGGDALVTYFEIARRCEPLAAASVLAAIGFDYRDRGDLDAAIYFLREAARLGADGEVKRATADIEREFRSKGALSRLVDSIEVEVPEHVDIANWDAYSSYLLGEDAP